MWQRIQTVYLILVILAGIIAYYLPIAIFNVPGNGENEHLFYLGKTLISNTDGTSTIENHSWLAALNGLSSFIALIAIFLFKNRKRQILFISLATLIVAGTIVASFYLVDLQSGHTGLHYSAYKLGGLIPIIQIVLLSLGRRAVKKDEALVRSADRLR